jgi:hypothetical protein
MTVPTMRPHLLRNRHASGPILGEGLRTRPRRAEAMRCSMGSVYRKPVLPLLENTEIAREIVLQYIPQNIPESAVLPRLFACLRKCQHGLANNSE